MTDLKLFDAELRFMLVLWEYEPVNSTELAKLCQTELGWKKPTTYTMIRKLAEKGALKNENAVVTALIKREQVQKYETEVLLQKAFNGSLPMFMTAFLQGRKITIEEARQLKKMIEEASH